MKLTVFRSGKGDCLLLSGKDGTNILVDGGMSNAYRDFVRPTMGQLAQDDQLLDLVYVSHIDEDHISGILEMMEDAVAWKRFDFQRASGNQDFDQPDFPRPPFVKAMWHNAFSAQVEDNQGAIQDQLVMNARITSGWSLFEGEMRHKVMSMSESYRNLATSERQGIELTRRARHQLGIPLNPETDGRLIFLEEVPPVIGLGCMNLYVLGPFEEDLIKLRQEWNEWLNDNQDVVEEIEAEIEADLAEHEGLRVMDEGQRLASMLRPLTAALGDRSQVTPPNLASLMLLAEECGQKVLLTGDGHADDILKGLKKHHKLNNEDRLHVDVLKVQHHGSKNNITEDFCRRVTAPHYVFCGNGDHHNPHLDAVRLLVETRAALQEDHPQSGQPYTLWFNCNAQVASTQNRRDHMQDVEDLARELEEAHPDLTCRFPGTDKFEIPLD